MTETSIASTTDFRLAVLIDADNVSHQNIRGMMEEIARYGNPTIKRIYGDWTRPNLGGWKPILLDYAISPIQQFGYTVGKNATDAALIIDAMDILYAEDVDGFCLVSSDSDFTRLATRLREAGKLVYGIGEQKTPNAFIAACDKFIYLEILDEAGHDDTDASSHPVDSRQSGKQDRQAKKAKTVKKIGPETIKLISSTIRDLADDNGWAFMGAIGSLLVKKQPSFDSRNFGFEKLTQMIKSIDRFEIDVRDSGHAQTKHIYVRIKK